MRHVASLPEGHTLMKRCKSYPNVLKINAPDPDIHLSSLERLYEMAEFEDSSHSLRNPESGLIAIDHYTETEAFHFTGQC